LRDYFEKGAAEAIKTADRLYFSRATVFNWAKSRGLVKWLQLVEDEILDRDTSLGSVGRPKVVASKGDWKWMAEVVYAEERKRSRKGDRRKYGFRSKSRTIQAAAKVTPGRRHLSEIGWMNLYRSRDLLLGYVQRLWAEDGDIPTMEEVRSFAKERKQLADAVAASIERDKERKRIAAMGVRGTGRRSGTNNAQKEIWELGRVRHRLEANDGVLPPDEGGDLVPDEEGELF
jgi:hypothetical protein